MSQDALDLLEKRLSSKIDKESLKIKMIDVARRLFEESLLVDRKFFIQKYNIESILLSRNEKTYEELRIILLKNLHEDD